MYLPKLYKMLPKIYRILPNLVTLFGMKAEQEQERKINMLHHVLL